MWLEQATLKQMLAWCAMCGIRKQLIVIIWLGYSCSAMAEATARNREQNVVVGKTSECGCSTTIDQCTPRNVATGKNASHSSNYKTSESDKFNANMAVDGYLPADPRGTPEADIEHCSHTNVGASQPAWWYVDLGEAHKVYSVNITKRVSDDRLKNFDILVGDDDDISKSTWPICAGSTELQNETVKVYNCSTPLVGRRVGIMLRNDSRPATENFVILCEVQVYAIPWTLPKLTKESLLLMPTCDNLTISYASWEPLRANQTPDGVDIWINGRLQSLTPWYRSSTVLTVSVTPGKSYNITACSRLCYSNNLVNKSCASRLISSESRYLYSKLRGDCADFELKASSSLCNVTQNFELLCEAEGLQSLSSANRSVCSFTPNKNYKCQTSISIPGIGDQNYTSIVRVPKGSQFRSFGDNNFTCACKGNGMCRNGDGFCQNGCNTDASGPGCQVGEIIRHANYIEQSSTSFENGTEFHPFLAIDGDSLTCSATVPELSNYSWWTTTLADGQKFFVMDLTLAAGAGTNMSEVSILLTNETNSEPNPNSWTYCRKDESMTARFTCNATLATKIAVYASGKSTLSICDLSLRGYIFEVCSTGYFGPGCLLQLPDSDSCRNSSYTLSQVGYFGECLQSRCPEDKYMPPQCYHYMPEINSSMVTANGYCEALTIEMENSFESFQEENATLNVTLGNSVQQLQFSLLKHELPFSRNVNISFGNYYNVTMTIRVCIDGYCANGPKTISTVYFPKRNATHEEKDGCAYFNIFTGSGCSSPRIHQIRCNGTLGDTIESYGSRVCNLNWRSRYNCTLTAMLNATQDVYTVYNVFVDDEPNDDPSIPASMIGGIVGGLLALLVAILFVYVIRRRRAKAIQTTPNISVPPKINQDSRVSPPTIEPSETVYDNIAGMTVEELEGYIKREDFIATKFQELLMNEASSCNIGRLPENKHRNRFQNILPYDFNRVVLDSTPDNKTGYINASHIKGYSKERRFLATQGPTARTLADFWNMVWSQNAPIIVMLTNFVEQGKRKCEEYFPVAASDTSNISVSVKRCIQYCGYEIRDMEISKGSEKRFVKHCFFQSWPDQSTPEQFAQFAMFRLTVRDFFDSEDGKRGPVIVHCSAGAGRTGAYIAIENDLDRYKERQRVDIDSCVLKLRQQRTCMVQTKAQYMFVHKAILHGIHSDSFAVSEAALGRLWAAGATDREDRETREWKVLDRNLADVKQEDYRVARLPENAEKNRNPDILASEKYRPYVTDIATGREIYVNAVYCNGRHKTNSFLASQLPMHQTMTDFWNLAIQSEASCIVVLDDPSDDQATPEFYPKSMNEAKKAIDLGIFHIMHIDSDKSTDDITCVNLSVTSSSKTVQVTRSVKVIELFDWPKLINSRPERSTFGKVQLMLRQCSRENPDKPVLVLCRDGATMSGVFIAAMNVLDHYVTSGNLLVFHNVEMLKCIRRQFVKDKAQYSFLYNLLESEYRRSNVYANL